MFVDIYNSIKNLKKTFVTFFKFQLVSIIAYWVDFGLYSLFYSLVFVNDYWISKPISYVIGLFTSYLLNKYWTFGVKRKFLSGDLVKFTIVSILALASNMFAIFILTEYFAVDGYLSAMAATLFSFIINYSGSKLWVFMNAEKK